MAHNLPQDDPGSGGRPELSDALLRDAFRASEDPELTLFLTSLERDSMKEEAEPRPDWRAHIDPPESDEEIGRIDGHILRALIAEGGMGVVFRGEELALARTVALKMLTPGLAWNLDARHRFLREAKAVAGLNHENVLPIFRVGEDPLPHFTMRYAGAGSLQDRLDRGGVLSLEEWFSLARQVAGALGAAHAVGIIHRDIKPPNLLYDDEGGRLWVADFGIAVLADDPMPGKDAVIGTPRYMSPEQARGDTTDGRSDLFSLGAVLYRCATGEDLVGGANSGAVFKSLLSTDFTLHVNGNKSIPLPQRRLLAKLLAPDPGERFGDASSFLEALAVEERTVLEKASSSGGGGVGLWVAVLVAVAVLAAAPFVIRSLRSDPDPVAALPAPSLPEIRIEGRDGVYRDFASAFADAPDGSTLLLDGVFVCRETVFGPEGKDLSLRSAEGAHAVVVASIPDQHALFFRGGTELHDITFVREKGEGNVMPIIGIYGGDALVRNCRFETVAPNGFLLGASLSFTHLENVLIDRCVFRTRGRDAMAFGFVDGSPSMRVTVRDSIVLAGVAMTRRVRGQNGPLTVEWEHSVVVADQLFLEHSRNPSVSFSSLAFQFRDCGLDLADAAIRFGNGFSPFDAIPPVAWTGERNRHARSSLRLDWSGEANPPGDATRLEIPLSGKLAPPVTGSETDVRIEPFLDRAAGTPMFDHLIEAIRRDPVFADLVPETGLKSDRRKATGW